MLRGVGGGWGKGMGRRGAWRWAFWVGFAVFCRFFGFGGVEGCRESWWFGVRDADSLDCVWSLGREVGLEVIRSV